MHVLCALSSCCNIIILLVIEAYDAAERSMVRLNKTGAKLMHKYGTFYAINYSHLLQLIALYFIRCSCCNRYNWLWTPGTCK